MAVYPSGSGTAMISLDEMKRRHAGRMHPECARRFFAWIEAQGGQIGVGGGDGEYGPRTAECVESIQRWNGLEEDGRCGRNTWAAVDTYATR